MQPAGPAAAAPPSKLSGSKAGSTWLLQQREAELLRKQDELRAAEAERTRLKARLKLIETVLPSFEYLQLCAQARHATPAQEAAMMQAQQDAGAVGDACLPDLDLDLDAPDLEALLDAALLSDDAMDNDACALPGGLGVGGLAAIGQPVHQHAAAAVGILQPAGTPASSRASDTNQCASSCGPRTSSLDLGAGAAPRPLQPATPPSRAELVAIVTQVLLGWGVGGG